MKLVSSLLMVLLATWLDIGDIAKINKAKEEAAQAFKNGHFVSAMNKYKYLVEQLKVTEDQVLLNYAHACYRANDTTAAIAHYNAALKSANQDIRSISSQQLGVIRAKNKNYDQSLKHFKQALRDQPENHEARTNYEIVKKLLDQQRKQQQQQQQNQNQQNQQQKQNQQKQDQQKKDQENKDESQKESPPDKDQKAEKQQKEKEQQKDGQKKEGEEQDEKETDKAKKEQKEATEKRSQRLQKMNMTEEQAKMILDAMKNNEAQYLQQLQRKTTKRPDKGKPDW
jgi:Ca-activated chloride channel homolog